MGLVFRMFRTVTCFRIFQAYIQQDVTAEDIYGRLRTWYPAEGSKLLFQRDADQDEQEADDDFIPDLDTTMQELTVREMKLLAAARNSPEDAEAEQDPGTLIEKVASQAMMRESLHELRQNQFLAGEGTVELDEDTGDHGQASVEEIEDMATTDPLPLEREERDPTSEQPKTLRDILTAATAKRESCFDLREASAQGADGALRRVSCLAGPIRHFAKFVRLEEGLLSLAWIERQKAPEGEWNRAEHELAMARLAQDSSKTRVARATLWAASAASLCQQVLARNRQASEQDRGLFPVELYRPPVSMKDASFQIVLIKGAAAKAGAGDRKVVPCCVMAAFRGCAVRTKSAETVIRTGKPSSGFLQSSCARMIHASELVFDTNTQQYWTSSSSEPILFDPAGCVLGELTVAKASRVGMKLVIELTPAAEQAMASLRKPGAKLPELAHHEKESETLHKPPAEQPDTNTFTERSFSKAALATKVPLFLDGVRRALERMNVELVNSDGYVILGDQSKACWSDLCQRTVSYLAKEFKGLVVLCTATCDSVSPSLSVMSFHLIPQHICPRVLCVPDSTGDAFSRAVYSAVKRLVPDQDAASGTWWWGGGKGGGGGGDVYVR